MKRCEEYDTLLDPWIDGELSEPYARKVQAHLSECAVCRAYVDDALAIRQAFPSLETVAVPEGFSADVMTAVRAAPRKKRHAPWMRVIAPLAACLAVMLLVLPRTSLLPQTPDAISPALVEPAPAEPAPVPRTVDPPTNDTPTTQAEPEADAAPSRPASSAPLTPPEAREKVLNGPAAFSVSPDAEQAFATLTLSQDQAGSLMEAFFPVSETETEQIYHLTPQAFSTLLEELGETPPELPQQAEAYAEVIVTLP